MITQSKIRLTADNLKSYREIINLNKKTMSLSISASLETEFSDFFISFETESSDLFISIVKNKSSILSLIKEAQEFNSLCRQISSQLHEKSERNISFALIRNEILRKMNHVFMSQQKTIQVQLL